MDFITAANLILTNKFGLAELGQCKFDINAPQKKYKCVESEYGFFDEDSDGEAGEGAGDKVNRKLIYQYRHLTLLSVAVLANNLAAIKLLLKHGANPGLTCKYFEVKDGYSKFRSERLVAEFNAFELAEKEECSFAIIERLKQKLAEPAASGSSAGSAVLALAPLLAARRAFSVKTLPIPMSPASIKREEEAKARAGRLDLQPKI